MHSETIEIAQNFLFILLIILFIGTIGGKIAEIINIPDVVIFIFIGFLIGPSALGLINIDVKSVINEIVLLFGASLILFHGGLITRFEVLRNVWLSIILLSTVGVGVTALVVAISATYILHIPFLVAILLGAILASTDPAALIPIFRKFPIRPKVAQTVITESAFTDATGAILTTVVFGILVTKKEVIWGSIGAQFIQLAVGGALIGGIIGWLAAFLISENKRNLFREYTPMIMILTVLSSYIVAEWLHASGFMSVFIAGLMIGNASNLGLNILPKEKHSAHQFVDAIGLKMRMLIFIFLGSQVHFDILADYAVHGIWIVLIFMFIARPFTALISLLPDRKADWKKNEILFFFWTRETGVIAAALVGIISSSNLHEGKILASITFLAILFTLILQASTTPLVGKKLGLMQKLGEPSSLVVDSEDQ